MSTKRVVVIGAGFVGMATGAYLAKAGYDVTIIEKNKVAGGVSQTIKKKGFTFDIGPNWYMLPDIYEGFFNDFGTSVEQQYGINQALPSFKLFTHETDYAVTTWPEVGDLFDSLDPGSAKRLERLLHDAEGKYDALLTGKSSRGRGLLRRKRNFAQLIQSVTKNQDLQHILAFPSVFLGSPPTRLSDSYEWLVYAGLAQGTWHPKGGFGSVVKAVQSIAKKAGVAFMFGSPVDKIEYDHKQVTGVVVAGKTIDCDLVIANADMHHVETALLGTDAQSYDAAYWQSRPVSSSALVACLGVKRRLPGLVHHNLLFDVSWEQHLAEVYEQGAWSAKPTIYLTNPSKIDPSLAPKGMESLLLFAPMAGGVQPTEEQIERTTLSMIGRIQEEVGYEFINDIVVAEVKTHDYFVDTHNAYKGNLFGVSSMGMHPEASEVAIRSKRLKGLYYLGQDALYGSVAPLLGGKLAAGLLDKA